MSAKNMKVAFGYKLRKQNSDTIQSSEVLDENKSLFKTKVTIKCFDDGKIQTPVIISHNDTVYNGRLSAQEFIFGGGNPAQHLLLNDIENIPHSVNIFEEGKKYHKLRSVDYFCIGNGAESTVLEGDFVPERTSDTKLYNMVPFRCVPITSDLSDEEATKYRLRKKINIKNQDYYAYYAKKLEKSDIKVIYNGNNYIPKESDTSTLPDTDERKPLRSGEVSIYTVISLKIDAIDFKEYYQAMNNGSLALAKISEVGLISALDIENALNSNKLELAGAELFAKMCFTGMAKSSPTAIIELEYEVHT